MNLVFDFRKMHRISYGEKIRSYLINPIINYVIDGDSAAIGLNYTNYNNLLIMMGNNDLKESDVISYSNNVLCISNVEITLDGNITRDLYIRIRKGDTLVGTTATILYNEYYATNPLYYAGDRLYISYKYLGGEATLAKNIPFTIKYRDTRPSCSALNASELIANYTADKTNFNLFSENGYNSGVISSDVSEISLYSSAGNSFSNFKFVLNYGKV